MGADGHLLGVVLYATRVLPNHVRIFAWLVVGIMAGLLAGGGAGDDGAGFWGLTMTTVGASMAAFVLPTPPLRGPEGSPEASPDASSEAEYASG